MNGGFPSFRSAMELKESHQPTNYNCSMIQKNIVLNAQIKTNKTITRDSSSTAPVPGPRPTRRTPVTSTVTIGARGHTGVSI